MIAEWLYQRSLLIQELKEQNEFLRQENAKLYERVIEMAASVPHIKLAGPDVQELEIVANSPLATFDEEQKDLRVGNKGANVV